MTPAAAAALICLATMTVVCGIIFLSPPLKVTVRYWTQSAVGLALTVLLMWVIAPEAWELIWSPPLRTLIFWPLAGLAGLAGLAVLAMLWEGRPKF